MLKQQARQHESVRRAVFFLLLICCVASSNSTATSTSRATYAASQFKAPHAQTPAEIAQEWKKSDAALWSYVESHVPAVLDHTGSEAFDEHLKGVQAVLRYWQAPEHLTNAGLFHSIYGTEGFQGFALPLTERSTIQALIGEQAEKLCFVFCMVDRSTLDHTVFQYLNHQYTATASTAKNSDPINQNFTLHARPELGRFPMQLTRQEWLDFIELTLADWMEQVEGAAQKPSDLFLWETGEAYAYRRNAYYAMSRLLAAERPDRLARVVPAMVEAVYATESPHTRHLLQPLTPPVSSAAAAAFAALRAAGEPIPEDLAPQPRSPLKEEQQQECEA